MVENSGVRPFASYTSADHARIAFAETAWTIATRGYEAVVPERAAGDNPFPPIFRSTSVLARAQRLEVLAVILSHESGRTWEQIGRAFDITKQTAHQRFATHVNDFHSDLVAVLEAARTGTSVPEAIDTLPWRDHTGMRGYVVDTEWYAPMLDAWLVEAGEVPGSMMVAFKPGELLARLSDQATSTGYRSYGLRGLDAYAPRCPFTADFPDADEPGLYLACTMTAGHGGRHSLAVAGAE